MSKVKLWVAVAVVVGVMGGGWVFAQEGAGSAVRALTGQDYEHIKELYARYNQGSDFRDADLFLSAFAEDAVMTRGGRATSGMAALRAERVERYAGETGDNGRRHYNGSWVITPTATGAKARAYYMVYDVSTRPPTPVASGYYDDTFTRTSNGWLIQTRTLTSDGPAR
jgi:hypothetical protein